MITLLFIIGYVLPVLFLLYVSVSAVQSKEAANMFGIYSVGSLLAHVLFSFVPVLNLGIVCIQSTSWKLHKL